MSGFGGAPAFGVQALSHATRQAPSSSSSGPPASSTSLFSQQPAPTSAFPNSFQQSQSQTLSIFGSPTSNALGSIPSKSGGSLTGLNTTNKDAAMNNPFAAMAAPATAASNPFASKAPANPFGATSNASAPLSNPFGQAPSNSPFASAPAFGQPNQQSNATASPFGQPNQQSNNAASPFGQPSQPSTNAASPFSQANPLSNSPFGQPSQSSSSAASPFGAPASSFQKRKNAFEDKPDSKRPGTTFATTSFLKSQTNFATPAPAITSNASGTNGTIGFESNGSGGPQNKKTAQALMVTSRKKSPSVYAQEIHDRLRKDNLKPPAWPQNAGDPENIKAMDDYRVKYKAYEGKVRASLIKAGLIDDPDVPKKLTDAIDFRGICEDMCPQGEKVSRIVEYDVKQPERFRNTGTKCDGWANPDAMVKSFKRSAAGIDSPLPTEVRSPAALRRTVDYLIDELLQRDENLPFMHGFLWDRTRAIRKDFIFQNAMTPEERLDQIYCFENIARFHAVSLHLLSKDGQADFSEQQEREQLGKTLLSLMQVYDECKDMDITIEHEAEFRAYFLLFNAHDPFIIQQMQDWNDKFWFGSPEIQTAVSLIQVMQNVWDNRGPMKPWAPLATGSASFSNYFAIVEQPEVSYMMACVAQIHFTEIRRLILKALHKAYARVRDGPKDLTANVLNELFCFDTEEECVEYLKNYDMEFSTAGTNEPHMVVVRRRGIPHKTVKQSSSQKMVERKRGIYSFPDVVHTTVYEESSAVDTVVDSPNSLFVSQPTTPKVTGHKIASMDFRFANNESPSSTPPAPAKPSLAPPPTAWSTGFTFPQDKATPAPNAQVTNPFFSQSSKATTAPSTAEKKASVAQAATLPWASSGSSSSFFQSTSAPEERKQPVPTFSWSSTPNMAPPTSQDSSSVFSFMNKSPGQPQAPFLFPTAVSQPKPASSLFSAIPPAGDMDKGTETRSVVSATNLSTEASTYQETAIAPSSLFTALGSSAAPSTPLSSFVPSVPVSVPSTVPSLFGNLPAPASTPTFTPDLVSAVQTSTVPAAKPAPPAKDMMGALSKWVLLGDYGLMGQLEEKIVEDILRETYNGFREEERERKQRKEDEVDLADALAFRTYSLSVKYLHLWKHNARRRFARNAAKKNKVKMKEWREEKAAEAKAERIRKEKEERARQKRLSGPTSWLEELDKERPMKRPRAESMSLDTSRRTSPAASDAAALLATGIFDGLPNKEQYAANAVRDDDSLYDALVGVQIGPSSRRQVMGPPAKPVKDPLGSVLHGGISKQPPAPKQKWSKKAQGLRDLLSGKKKDEELLSFRGSTSSRLGQSVRSVPGGKVTNFSKYQSSSPRSSAELDRPRKGSSSGIKTSYWLLRSRGLYATPAGHVLSDRAPRPATGSIYDGTSQYSGESVIDDYEDRVLEQDGAYRASLGLTGGHSRPTSRRSTFSLGGASSPPRPDFLKPKPSSLRQSLPTGGMATSLLESRDQRGEADVASQAGSAVSTMAEDVEETLRELRQAAAALDEDTEWFREQNGRMSQNRNVGA